MPMFEVPFTLSEEWNEFRHRADEQLSVVVAKRWSREGIVFRFPLLTFPYTSSFNFFFPNALNCPGSIHHRKTPRLTFGGVGSSIRHPPAFLN